MLLSNNLRKYLERMKAQGVKCQNITKYDVRCYQVAKSLGLISQEWVDSFSFKLSEKAKSLLTKP